MKGPISTKWVDVDKSHCVSEIFIWSRWVARDFIEKGEKDRGRSFQCDPAVGADEVHAFPEGYDQG